MISAILLAAGQSKRMNGINKLTKESIEVSEDLDILKVLMKHYKRLQKKLTTNSIACFQSRLKFLLSQEDFLLPLQDPLFQKLLGKLIKEKRYTDPNLLLIFLLCPLVH